ncbi:uncharacterized protein LOC126781104 [Nymphalis io]|uniref:uncharacterized protein LOC126781104 n=1 Tax=Inachis io TaxID=171585 RepID=UPI002167DBE8|nr:uncharacterized protein LOC126781104 [Nymphalis io]
MRRKSERTATKKTRSSPEPKEKVEKVKRTRTRRRKQSSSSESESAEDPAPKETVVVSQTETNVPPKPAKEDSPEESQEQVWHVKATESSGDVGEIKKLKICLARPPSTPERPDRSPRSRRKHSRATSSSDTQSVEGEDKKKAKHRSKRLTESKDMTDKNQDSQGDEAEVASQTSLTTEPESTEVSESTQQNKAVADETPMSTTTEEVKDDKVESTESNESKDTDQKAQEESKDNESKDKPSDADTTVVSPKSDDDNDKDSNSHKNESPIRKRSLSEEKSEILELHADESRMESSEISLNESQGEDAKATLDQDKDISSVVSNEVSINESTTEISGKRESNDEDVISINKNDVVESTKIVETGKAKVVTIETNAEVTTETTEIIHEDQINEKEDNNQSTNDIPMVQTSSEVSNNKTIKDIPEEETTKNESNDEIIVDVPNCITTQDDEVPDNKIINEDKNNQTAQDVPNIITNQDVINNKISDVSEDLPETKSQEISRNNSIPNISNDQSIQEVSNEQTTPLVINRKRRWGSRPSKLSTQKSLTISTDILKEIIPDVKPAEFDEVIEEKKHKRVEVAAKIERPVLPKIIIDNTENVEIHKDHKLEDKDKENVKAKDSNLASMRKISIVRDSDNFISRPPSPPKHKQSSILYITNLVRPFTLPQLKNLLQRTGKIMENGFWIDRIKSKCFVKYENEDQAVETRHALHGVTWPVSNPKTLHVDFSTDEDFDKAKANEDTDNAQASTIPGTVEDWLREQDLKREKGEIEKPWEKKASMREWDFGKNEKNKETGRPDKMLRDERPLEKRRHRTPERSPEPARKFKKKEEEAPAKLLDDLFRKTKTTPCIYWLPLSAETIAIKEEQRRQHMAEHERRLQELRRTHRRHLHIIFTSLVFDFDKIKLSYNYYFNRLYSREKMQTWLVLVSLVFAVSAENPFTLEEFVTGQFAQRGFTGTWISDTEFTYTIAGEPGIYVFDVPTLSRNVLVSGELMSFLNTTRPILSEDRRYILAPSEVESVYRYSTTAKFALYEIATGNVKNIANHQRLQLCIFGGGHSLAYVLDNNLYYLPQNSDQPVQITNDGIPGVIYNGHADWVYEEDVMYTGEATWFSPDGNYLAFASYDDTLVETYSYYYYVDKSDPDDLYPELVHLKYPKVGRVNPKVSLRVVDLRTAATTLSFINLEAPSAVTNDHILGGVTWPSATEIAAHWLNRRQNYTVLSICNVVTLQCEEEHRSQSNGWVPIALPRFSRAGDFYVSTRWSLEQADGNIWQHLYVSIRLNGDIVSSSVTPGAFTVNNFVGMDEDNLAYYYTRTVTGAPWQSQVHVSGARAGCLSCELRLPDGGPCAWATATASRRASYLTITCQSPEEPSATYIIDPLTRRTLYVWEDNQIVRDRLVGKSRPQSIITTVPLENGYPAPVRLFLPPGLNVSDTTTKYPVVFYVYSGPNTNTVYDTFTVGYHSYLTTSRNTIYMLADRRGAGLNGQEMLYSLNNALGTVEIFDHFVVLRQVLSRYGFMDPDRVAIWGHSYGGYATLLTLVHDDQKMFQCGVSTAPVTSWLYYNTMYTERYMGVPTADDNLSGYEAGDVTLLAEKLRGKKFYVMHGNADDNVHYQNAAKLFKILAELNIPFDQMSYPDEAHSLAGVNMHRYGTMNRYWEKCIGIPDEAVAEERSSNKPR